MHTYKPRLRPWGIRCQSAAGGRVRSGPGPGRQGGAGRECSGQSPGQRPFPCPRAAESRRLLAPGPAPPPSCSDRLESLWLLVCCQQSVTSGPPLSNRGGVPRSCPAANAGGGGRRFRALRASPDRAGACVPQVSLQGPFQRRAGSQEQGSGQDWLHLLSSALTHPSPNRRSFGLSPRSPHIAPQLCSSLSFKRRACHPGAVR